MSGQDALLDLETVLRLGRVKATHRPRVLIEDDHVVLRTRCGLDPLPDGFTETRGVVTCTDCLEATP